jgi:hypothetical protein
MVNLMTLWKCANEMYVQTALVMYVGHMRRTWLRISLYVEHKYALIASHLYRFRNNAFDKRPVYKYHEVTALFD